MANTLQSKTVLETRDICLSFGALEAAKHLSFKLPRGGRRALIGPNGAGKTTFINLLTGKLMPSSGRILLNDNDISALPFHARVKLGLVRTFQISTLLRKMTVLENVQLAALERRGRGSILLGGHSAQAEAAEEAFAMLVQLDLGAYAGKLVGELAYGIQRLVEIAVALTSRPSVLLLDEPAAGVPPAESRLIVDVINQLSSDISVLLIEHDMNLVFRFADWITVMAGGAILCEGSPREIAADPRVKEVYLGARTYD